MFMYATNLFKLAMKDYVDQYSDDAYLGRYYKPFWVIQEEEEVLLDWCSHGNCMDPLTRPLLMSSTEKTKN